MNMGMGMIGNDGNPASEHDDPLFWGHYYTPGQYPVDNTRCMSYMANPSPEYSTYDITTSSSTDPSSNWDAYSMYTAQSSIYSNSPLTDNTDFSVPGASRCESIVAQMEEPSSKRAAEPEEKSARKQPRRGSTRKRSSQDESEMKTIKVNTKVNTKVNAKANAKTSAKPSTKPNTKPSTKPNTKPSTKPSTKVITKTNAKTKSKPQPKSKLKVRQASPEEMEAEEQEFSQGISPASSVTSPRQDMSSAMTTKIQERNRVASNKFRVKKREDAKQLKVDEYNMKEVHRDLSGCVADLTLEVYNLKMRLLQHTDCNCHLIQEYIANEAQLYIKDLGEEEVHGRPPGQYQMMCPNGMMGGVE